MASAVSTLKQFNEGSDITCGVNVKFRTTSVSAGQTSLFQYFENIEIHHQL